MADRLPEQRTGKWTFRLLQEQSLQFRIDSEQEADSNIVIDGHDISALLDYLYNNRELIYEATHDHERRHLEAMEAREGGLAARPQGQEVERVFYIDDGEGRVRAGK
jgi:hypothetical protein